MYLQLHRDYLHSSFYKTINPMWSSQISRCPILMGWNYKRKLENWTSTISVVIMTGYGTIDMAVQALKDGAYDFLQKPFNKDHIVRVVDNCCERTVLLRTNMLLKEQLDELTMSEGFIGQSWHLTRAL
ncbi:MAG: response regulator, partial [Bacteroidetes bacterium]|nr:response regulator [Bacteroidota bacterium]